MAFTDEQEKEMEELFKVKLKEQYNRGLQVGSLSVSKVILDKLNDNSKPFMKRVEDVKKFCAIPWNKQTSKEPDTSSYSEDYSGENANVKDESCQ